LKRFARNHGVHLWVIAHPNKMQTGKDNKIAVPSLYDISGSANWANKADNGIVVHRSDDIADATEIWVKKVRFKHVGKRGMTTLKYNKTTGRYSMPEGGDDKIYSMGGEEEIQTYEPDHGY
jgi:twinkle protein